jgi:dTDP-4-amino-4,6-dideoxygalactose transaminase
VYNQFVVRAPRRDALRKFLESRGIGTAVYYPEPFHTQAAFRYLDYGPGTFPHAEDAAQNTLALPVFSELSEEQQKYVVESIAEFLQ